MRNTATRILGIIMLLVVVEPAAVPSKAALAGERLEVEPLITMNMREASLGSVLRAWSRETGISYVLGEGVAGTVSVALYRATPLEALAAILRPSGCSWIRKGQTIFISTKKLMRCFALEHIPADEAKEMISSAAPEGVKVSSGKTANTVVVEASPENMETITRVIDEIDGEPKQVLVMAKIVELNPSDDLNLGINVTLSQVTPFGADKALTKNFAADPDAAANAKGFYVKLAGPNWSAIVEALETKKDVNILSSPNIMTLNHHKAMIMSGEKFGYRVKTTTETSTIEDVRFLEVGTILDYTPHITAEGNVILEIHPKVSEGEISADGLPHERTTETTTSVIVNSGETIAIGGLIKQKLTRTEYGIPLLGQIPIFGALFRRAENKVEKKEIVVFINPAIVSPALNSFNTQNAQRVEQRFKEGANPGLLQ